MKRSHAGVILVAGVLAAGAAWAHEGATGIVKERMDAMKDIGSNVKTIGEMLRGENPYDPAKVEAASGTIASYGGEAMTELFPEGSLHEPSEATPAVWTDFGKFSDLAAELQASALELEALAEEDADQQAIAAAFGKVSATCRSCHQEFRVKK